jgi:hypothetical protein
MNGAAKAMQVFKGTSHIGNEHRNIVIQGLEYSSKAGCGQLISVGFQINDGDVEMMCRGKVCRRLALWTENHQNRNSEFA